MVTRNNSASRDRAQQSPSQEPVQQPDVSRQRSVPSEPVAKSRSKLLSDRVPFFQRFRLRTKIVLCAAAVSMIPAIGMGVIQYSQLQSSQPASQSSTPNQNNPQIDARTLLLSYLGTAALTALLVGEAALLLSDRFSRSVLLASQTARKLGQGKLESRLAVEGRDELAVLAANLNWMADQVQAQLSQAAENQSLQLLRQITVHLAQSQQVDESLTSVVQAVRQVFEFDRVLIYRIEPNGVQTLVTESVNSERISVMDVAIEEPWLKSTFQYSPSQVECIADVDEANLSEQTIRQLAALSVKASLTAPIVINDRLLGIVITHRCAEPHHWQSTEIEVCSQLATQIGLAWERAQQAAEFAQLSQQKDKTIQAHQDQQDLLQAQLRELLQTIESVAQGHYTARAITKSSEGETDTQETKDAAATCDAIAAAFNKTLENLQQIAAQINQSLAEVEPAVQANQQRMGQLQVTTLAQTETLTQAAGTIEDLIHSLQASVLQTNQASPDLKLALSALATKAQTVNQNGKNLLRWSEVATVPIQRVKRLGQDCQELTKRVAAANQLLLTINTLVLNASVHPQQISNTQSFGLMANHLAELTNQSSNAIQEIEQLLTQLQEDSETVVQGVKQAISFISLGKDFVELSDQQIEQTQAISEQIQQLMQSISSTTETQIQTTQAVLDLVKKSTSKSQDISSETTEVEQSLQQILMGTKQLQESVETFKVSNS